MSSLSLTRVLQPRKTSLELERENFEKFQAVSISKAVNSVENPVKEKHVRSAILGTFRERNGEVFWNCVSRLPLQENRIIAWKFCHMLHKVLREGHPQVIAQSLKHTSEIEDLGKLWGHLKEGYGKLIQQYCQLLLAKLDFHRRNPAFPGNLIVSNEDLEKIGDNDINNYFQISVEMFDYMDEILALQGAIFGSLDRSRSNSMTSAGQCRLAPLIPCIQDSSQLYDFCVKILFKLHASLPPDLLSGHRQRFLKQFNELRQFYLTASTLQYFKNLIQIPLLPDTAPNLLIQAELRSYVSPVVVLPPTPTSEIAELVDFADSASTSNNGSMSPDILIQRDNLIEQLQAEISDQREAIVNLQKTVMELREHVADLELQLATKESELSQEKAVKEDLLLQTEAAAKYPDVERRARSMEEKFNKLKEVYTKLREEHIQLIRQKAGIEKALQGSDKMTKFARAANRLISSIKADVDKQLASVKNVEFETNERTKLEDELTKLQATADAATEQNEALVCKVEWACNEKAIIESELQDVLSQRNEMESRIKQVEDERDSHLRALIERCRVIVSNAVDQVDSVSTSALTCTPEYLGILKDRFLLTIESFQFSKPIDVATLSCHAAAYIVHAKATSNTAPDLEMGERMSAMAKEVGKECIEILVSLHKDLLASLDLSPLRGKISELGVLANAIQTGESPESLGDLVENELAQMDKAIEEAAKKMEAMLNQSRKEDSGIKLEVNEKILDSCTTLMKAIRILVQKSKLLQAEIVAHGNTSSLEAKEFYKRNHQWTEGLISAAKAVGSSAKYLLDAADQVVCENGQLERVVVAAQGVAASTAQLVVASRVKADRQSDNLAALSAASRDVTHATGTVVATSKACRILVQDSEDQLDISSLSLHQAKRLEMECQVRVLELESGLEKERLRLSALRKHHYQLADENGFTS